METAALHDVEMRLREQFERALDGDAAAYHRFLDELAGHLRAFLRKRIAQAPDEVEDVLQDTLLAIHNGRHTYRRGQPLTAWVYAIARYKAMDRYRGQARRPEVQMPLDDAAADLLASVDDEAAHAQRDVLRLLDTLPDRHRLPIQYVKLEGLSVAEAAQRTGMSEPAVKVGIHRGLKALAKRLRDAP